MNLTSPPTAEYRVKSCNLLASVGGSEVLRSVSNLSPKEIDMKKPEQRLTSMELCNRYGISFKLLEQWRKWEAFPNDAAIREGVSLKWDPKPVDHWLKARPISRTGRPPKWFKTVHGVDLPLVAR